MTLSKTISTKTNQTNRLSVQVSLTGLSFLVTNLEGETIFFTERVFESNYTPEELLIAMKEVLSGTAELNQGFSEVKLIYLTQNYTTVPLALFDENKASEYLKFNTKILGNDFISHDEIENNDMVVVYIPFVNINNYVFKRYGEFTYHHGASLLLKNILDREKRSENPKVYLHINQKQFDCVIVKNGKLLLCNSFLYNTPEDLVYYVLFCFEQLNLNPDSVETKLCGHIQREDPHYEILYTYIRNVDFIEDPQIQFSGEPHHEHFLLKVS